MLTCANCGTANEPGARFCLQCGRPLAAAAPPPPPPVAPQPMAPQPTPQPMAPPRPPMPSQPVYAGAPAGYGAARSSSIQPLQVGILAGAALTIAGTLLAWVKFSMVGQSGSFNAWASELTEDNEEFPSRFLKIADIAGSTLPIDAIILTALAIGVLLLVLGPIAGIKLPSMPLLPVLLGVGITVLSAVNYLHVSDQVKKVQEALKGLEEFPIEDIGGVSFTVGEGLYLTIAGGVIIAVCAFLDYQQRAKAM